ncbi:hypothetical protein [Sanyastnella coralliicola]|uniref:hypothetical protein n=1 Tax=Sanyastnella coralliicola TaxID=3069118 RepID=UPI0027BB00CA|nr:hypothetical protein [Longitalea sp. SCSIO 12813]
MYRQIAACLVVCFFVVLTNYASAQSRYRVNNNPGVSADFTDLASAIAGSAAGDTLVIEHSDVAYNVSEVEINIELVIYGTGFFLVDNPGNQADIRASQLGPINITADGVVVSGLSITDARINANSVVFERNYVSSTLTVGDVGPTKFNIVRQNYMRATVPDLVNVVNSISMKFHNNLLWNETDILGDPTATNLIISASSAAMVYNNVFYGSTSVLLNNVQLDNNVFEESVIDPLSTNVAASSNFAENSFLSLYQPTDNIVETDSTFEVLSIASRDAQFGLRTDIPNALLNAGSDGTDVGIFGGQFSYVLSGMPPIPSIYFYEQETSSDGDLEIQIKTKTNK